MLKKLIYLSIFVLALNGCTDDDDKKYSLPEISDERVRLPYTVLENLNSGVEVRNGGFGSASTAHPFNDG